MAENTGIEWADHTFNPWVGCTKVSPACDFCYAEKWALRTGQAGLWAGDRRLTSDSNWNEPVRWNRRAQAEGRRYRVFCASLADVFDNKVPKAWRDRLWKLIRDTPHLDWLLLTKRPQLIAGMLPEDWGDGYPNVWLGTTVENQTEADRRVPHLLAVPATIRFLSCEPLLGPVDLSEWLWGPAEPCSACPKDEDCECGWQPRSALAGQAALHWVICGGESGPQARPTHPDGPRSLLDQCQSTGTAFLFKQWGEWVPYQPDRNCTVLWHSQNGEMIDRHHIPDLDSNEDPRSKYWSDACLYEGDDICLHLKVGKKLAGRMLDGRTWDEFPKVAA
ncbi:DUF5131 family protein [Inquilinus sp. CA228]|uniref:DUF5131 family protein n=1 Tax=Inquilinus sp. CA228 TaxID=3455609 RepID=UPI003F8D6811